MRMWSEFREREVFDPGAAPREKRPLKVEEPQVYFFPSMDGVELRLTRYQGGSKGPVILSHCIGVSQRMYSSDTIETNLLEYLFARSFDVWLLDHRLSIELPASSEQSTMDDVATKDYPAAVAKVRELSGAPSVQVVAHGVGSSTFTMALLSGLEGVRAAVCSQVSTHLFVPWLNRLKSRLPAVLQTVGIKSLTTYTDAKAGLFDRVYNASLAFYPMAGKERCRSPVCRRITSVFGTLYEHDQYNAATHRALHEMFGVVNLTAMRQLSMLSRVTHLVNQHGEEVYLPHLDRMRIPIAFIHGADNLCVLPKSTEITLDVVSKANGQGLYRRHLIPDYGHVDCILGKNADQDVYPHIAEHLEQTG